MKKPIKVAIAEDHLMIREFLVKEVNLISGFTVVLSVENGQELLKGLSRTFPQPDICIIDINMPVLNGYDAQSAIRQRWPDIRCLAISLFDDAACITQMLANGACGFISKNSFPDTIALALEAIVKDGYYYDQIDPKILEKTNTLPALTDREKEYLELVCAEYSQEEIASKLYITEGTLQHYRDAVHRKLKVNNKADLLFYVKRTGIVYMNEHNTKK